jgi:hypothetical protein
VVVVAKPPARSPDKSPSWEPSPPTGPRHVNNSGGGYKSFHERELAKTALRLYDYQYNVVPVDQDKRPLTSWSSQKRIELEELKGLLPKATGIAIVAGPENYWGDIGDHLVIIDVDNPGVLEKSPKLRWVLDNTVTWKTGPRCPRCYNKHLEVLEPGRRFRCKCGHEFTLEEAARGLGALVLVNGELVRKHLGGSTQRPGPVELLVNNYQLMPPSLHPIGVKYEWVRPLDLSLPNHGLLSLGEEDLRQLLEELKSLAEESKPRPKPKPEEHAGAEAKAGEGAQRLRELREHEILEVVDALLPAYRPGVRQYLWLFLSGWAAKARVSPVSVARVLKALYDKTGDGDSIRTRASAIVYSYRKAGVDLGPYVRALEEVLGVKPYGLEGEIREEEVKGRSGLQEILEQVLGEERALDVIRQVEEIFGTASPYKGDSIVELLDYEKQLYAVANLRKLVVVRATRRDGRLVYRERVFEGAPVEVEVYVNPVGGVTKYKVRWAVDQRVRPRPLDLGPAYVDDIVDRLILEGLVYHSRLAPDILRAVLNGFLRKGRAIVRTELESPGFYEFEGKLIAVGYEVREPSREELRESLELLNELGEEWFKQAIERFSTVIKWGAIAPFNYIYKIRKRWIKWLYLYGASNTGKTTMALIATIYMWGLRESVHVKSGASIDTVAKVGHILSQSTLPVVVNEPGGALGDEAVVELLKNAIESPIARSKHHKGSYVDIPALAPVVFTSNKYLPRDDALLKRFKVLRFTPGDRIPQERVKEFEVKVKPRLQKLKAIGQFIASYVLKHGLGEDPEAYAVKLLEEAYKTAGLTPPKWLYLEVGAEDVGEVYESIVEQIRGYILKRVNEEYNKYVGRVDVETSEGLDRRYRWQLPLEERLKIVLEYQLIPWLLDGGEEVIVTGGLVEDLKYIVGDIGGLKGLAELVGWEYAVRRVGGKNAKVAVTRVKDFVRFLAPPVGQ